MDFDFAKLRSETESSNSDTITDLPQDPDSKIPGSASAKPAKKAAAPKTPGRPSRERVRDGAVREMQEEIEGFLLMAAFPLRIRDFHADGSSCADLFMQWDEDKGKVVITPEAKAFAAAFAEVGVDNRFIKKFFELGDGASKWLTLAMATQPLVMGIISSHGGGRFAHRNSPVE